MLVSACFEHLASFRAQNHSPLWLWARMFLPRIADFSQAESALRSEKSVEIREICGRQLSAQCAKEQAECIYSPTDLADKHRYHAGCFYQKTRIAPIRTDGSFHGFFTLAPLPTAWGLMRRRRGRSTRIFRRRSVACDTRKIRLRSTGPEGHQKKNNRSVMINPCASVISVFCRPQRPSP